MFNKKQILVVGNDGVQLYVTNGKRTSLYEDFSDAGGNLSSGLRAAFKKINAPLILLFDVVEQQYRKETIPQVSFIDRKKIILRKLMMAFPQQQMRAFLPSKQKPRAGDSMIALFAALSPNLTATQIMDAMLGSEVIVMGCALLPVESTSLILKIQTAINKKFKTARTSRWAVLMTYHQTGGMRQIVTKDGELALTRLTPLAIDPHNADELAEEMQREFNATLTYLARFGYEVSEGLDLIIIGAEELCQKFAQHRLPVSNLRALTLREAGKYAGFSVLVDSRATVFGDVLHAGWMGVQRKIVMPLSAQLMDKVIKARQMAQLVMFALIICLAYGGWQMFDLQTRNMDLQKETVDIKSRRVVLQTEYDALSKKLNTLKYPPEQTKLGLDIYDEFDKRGLHVEPILRKITAAIDKSAMMMKEIYVDSNASTSISEYITRAAGGTNPTVDPAAEKAQMTIAFEVGFADNTPVEKAAMLTSDLAETLRAAFPGRQVTVDKMVGNLAIDKTVQGISEQVAANKVDGRLVKEDTSTIKITGIAE